MVCVRKGEEAMFTSGYKQELVPSALLAADLRKAMGPYSVPLIDTIDVLDESHGRWETGDYRCYTLIFAVAVNCDVEVQLREPGTLREVNAVEVWGAAGVYYGKKVQAIKLGGLLLTTKVTSSHEVTIHFNEDGEAQLDTSRYNELAHFLEKGLRVNLDEVMLPFSSGAVSLTSLLRNCRKLPGQSMVVYKGPLGLDGYLKCIGGDYNRRHLRLV